MLAVLVGTRKGLFVLRSDRQRRSWALEGPHFLGQVVNHALLDPRDGRTLLAAVKAGHLGPTIFRSEDLGRSWSEAETPPAFPKAAQGAEAESVSHVFWLAPGHAQEPGRWYAGTSPQGLFASDDHGRNWRSVAGFNANPDRRKWIGGAQDAPPDGGTMHSINVDPADPGHLYIGMSGGGVFDSPRWRRNMGTPQSGRGCGLPPRTRRRVRPRPPLPAGAPGERRCVPAEPLRHLPARPGGAALDARRRRDAEGCHIGFPLVLHPRDPSTLWVFPMDGGTVWPRVPIAGRPAAYRSRDAGATWQRLDRGLPPAQGWFTVKRQAMAADALDPVGIYFGTTGGEVWASFDEGDAWQSLRMHLPHVYSVETALLA